MNLPKRMLTLLALTGAACLTGHTNAQPVGDDVQQIVETQFELDRFSIQRLDLPADNVSFMAEINLGGVDYAVWIEPRSFRSPGATASTTDADGNRVELPLPAPLTVRGQVEGVPEARAAGSRVGGGLHLSVVLPGAPESEIWTIQPLYDAVEGADPSIHVVHRADDVKPNHDHTCGVDHNAGNAQADGHGGGAGTRAFLVCELACDADWEYFNRNNQDVPTTIADIDNIIARTSAVYEGQCNVTFQIPHYEIWTTSNDPYTTTDPSGRLTQFRNWWQANQGAINRDLVHGFTGVNLNGSVIGIAYLSAVCNSNQYGLVQSRFTTGINRRMALSAHEIGHNFSSGHCDGNGDCHIMCSGLGGCNGLGNPAFFGTSTANRIRNYAANRPCLEEDGLPYPFLEEWAEINDTFWPVNNGAELSTDADNEPSSPNSLNLDGTDSIESGDLDLASVTEPPFVSAYAQHKGVEAGKTLEVQYRDFFNAWNTILTFTSDGNDQTNFVFATAEVPVTGWSETFALRIVANGADASDDWYIDDVSVAPFEGNPTPFLEEFTSTVLNSQVWGSAAGVDVNTDATNEPSDPYAMNLDGTDVAETNNFLMGSASFPTFVSFFTQHKGVENGKSLSVEYLNLLGTWTPLTTVTSDGSDQNNFVFFQEEVNFDAYHDDFALRFTAQGADSSDNWYLDDIRLGDEFTPPDPCYADFNDDGTVNTTDVLAFLNAWNAGDTAADCNDDGNVNTTDVLCFLNLWNAGC